jgi:hypothetical protein
MSSLASLRVGRPQPVYHSQRAPNNSKRKAVDIIDKFGYNIVTNTEGVADMPNIRPSAYLRNNYNEVSEFCHSKMEPVFITINGHGDLAVLSIEAYEKF